MKEYSHVVLVVGGIEAGDVDQGITLTVTKILRVERGPAGVVQPNGTIIASVLDPSRVLDRGDGRYQRCQKEYDRGPNDQVQTSSVGVERRHAGRRLEGLVGLGEDKVSQTT